MKSTGANELECIANIGVHTWEDVAETGLVQYSNNIDEQESSSHLTSREC
jgi:hypothetical protein